MVVIPDQKLKEVLTRDGVIAPEVFDSFVEESKRMGQTVAENLISAAMMNSGRISVVGSFAELVK